MKQVIESDQVPESEAGFARGEKNPFEGFRTNL